MASGAGGTTTRNEILLSSGPLELIKLLLEGLFLLSRREPASPAASILAGSRIAKQTLELYTCQSGCYVHGEYLYICICTRIYTHTYIFYGPKLGSTYILGALCKGGFLEPGILRRFPEDACPLGLAQRAQYPLLKESTFNDIGISNAI